VLYASDDPRALRDALSRVVRDAGLRARLAAAGRERVRGYSWPQVAGRVATFYEGLLRERC
jgi:glycosyltransferase involved in cell wall biosynthesis